MPKKTYTQEFKCEAVRLAQTSGKPIAHIARVLGISDASIYQWHKELAAHGKEAFPMKWTSNGEGGRNCVVSNGNWR